MWVKTIGSYGLLNNAVMVKYAAMVNSVQIAPDAQMDPDHTGNILKQFRLTMQMTQAEMANMIGTKAWKVSDAERDSSPPAEILILYTNKFPVLLNQIKVQ
jgi:DNA-binding XRE family transcriptional regulator